MNYKELSKQIHQNAVNKGFWDTPPSYPTASMLIVSELGEACEAERKNRWANDCQESYTPEEFKLYIKDTVEDEIADAAIRILDCVDAWGVKFNPGVWSVGTKFTKLSEMLALVTKEVVKGLYWSAFPDNTLESAFEAIVYLCKCHEIDLARHIKLKMEYNATRERLHGKAY